MSARLTRTHPSGLIVSAEWDDAESGGPQRVTIAAGEITERTLRRVGRLVDDMTAEFHEMPAVGAFTIMIRQYVEDRLADLPAEEFHRGLLDIYRKIDEEGGTDPVRVIAAATRMPEETVRACLRVARQRTGD